MTARPIHSAAGKGLPALPSRKPGRAAVRRGGFAAVFWVLHEPPIVVTRNSPRSILP